MFETFLCIYIQVILVLFLLESGLEVNSKLTFLLFIKSLLISIFLFFLSFSFLVSYVNIFFTAFVFFIESYSFKYISIFKMIYASLISVFLISIISYAFYSLLGFLLISSHQYFFSMIMSLIIVIANHYLHFFIHLFYIKIQPLGICLLSLGSLFLFFFLQTNTLPSITIPVSIFLVLLALSSYRLGELFAEKRSTLEKEKNLENYVLELENLNDELRTFKHDYVNLLLTLEESIREKRIDQIEKIYYQTIAPTKHQILDKRTDIQKYQNIRFLELRSILIAKEMEAKEKGCEVDLAVIGIIHNPIKNSTNLIRAISILIDNAIQAASSSKYDKKIEILIMNIDNDLNFSCRNSIKGLDFDPKKMFEKKYSTKTANQSNMVGIGLYSLKRILSKNPSFTLSTDFQIDYISQSLFIKNFQ